MNTKDLIEEVLDNDLIQSTECETPLSMPVALQIQVIRELQRLNNNVIDVETAVRAQS